MTPPSGMKRDDYASVRRVIAVLLACFLGTILLIDALSSEYQVDPVVTGSILGAIVAIVGVDLAQRPFRKDRDE